MLKLKCIFFFLICNIAFAQEIEEDLSTTIYLEVVNPFDIDLTLLVKSRYPKQKYVPTRFQVLKAKDTTQTYFALHLEENRTPPQEFILSIHESPSYYGMNDHYYWKCERIEGEMYTCRHTIENYFKLTDSTQLDTAKFLREEYNSLPIYESYAVDSAANYESGMLQLFIEANEYINRPNEEYAVYVEFVVETNGTISDFKVLKSSDDELEKGLQEFFEKKQFTPAYKNGQKVRSKLTFPVSQRH